MPHGMLESLDFLQGVYAGNTSIERATDLTLGMVQDLGFTTLIYDYSPVAVSYDGALNTPTCISLRNVPDDMRSLWCFGGFYQRDPVQQLALSTNMPFVWSMRQQKNTTRLGRYLSEEHMPLVSYLHDADLTMGVTVPIQHSRGDLATCTAIRQGSSNGFEKDAMQSLAALNLIGQVFHDHVYSLLNDQQRRGGLAHLTPRERDCLRYSADGYTAKEIARRLNRSVATITQHLQTAVEKLGARNRLHAVMLAHHHRLLE